MTYTGLMRRRKPSLPKRKGATVIEIVVTMVIFAIGLLGVASMTASASRRSSGLSYQAGRDGIVLQELNRLASLTYDTIATRLGCTNVSSATLSYQRCISVTDVTGGSGYKRVRVIITPTTSYARAETVYVNRAKGAASNPLSK